ncbi:MAG: hypothetical protein AAFY15_10530, partial [Cyanobacteria bacterium J06648_11]
MGTTYANASTSSRAQRLWTAGLTGIASLGAIALGAERVRAFSNPTLEVGIVQRFGTDPKQRELTFEAPAGSLLTLEFEDEVTGQLQRQRTDSVTVAIANEALTTPETLQRLILSSHRSFESAAASAHYWNGLGVETEIAQPDEWQVWADRETYSPSQLIQIQIYARDNDIPSVRPYERTLRYESQLGWTWNGQSYTTDT